MNTNILGAEVEDSVTGFEGIATHVAHYLNGCVRVTVESRAVDNKMGIPSISISNNLRLLVRGSKRNGRYPS